MTAAKELDSATHEAIKAHSARGDELADARNFEAAIAEYNKAWQLVPEPKNEWDASTWILAAIGDAAFRGGYNTSAREALQYAMHCPAGIGNPFLHLRLGQVLYDAGEEQGAADELLRAYMAEGEEIFAAEDSKYLDFLRRWTKL